MKCFNQYGAVPLDGELMKVGNQISNIVKEFIAGLDCELGELRAIDSYLAQAVTCPIVERIVLSAIAIRKEERKQAKLDQISHANHEQDS